MENAFYATGIVFFMWPVLALTLLFRYAWDLAVFFGAAVWVKLQQRKKLFLSCFFAFFLVSFGVDALAALLILILSVAAQQTPALLHSLEAPFVGITGTLAAVAVILLVMGTGALKYWLYRRFVFRALETDAGKKTGFLLTLALLTAPWLFLTPTRLAFEWLGVILSNLGSLTGGAGVI